MLKAENHLISTISTVQQFRSSFCRMPHPKFEKIHILITPSISTVVKSWVHSILIINVYIIDTLQLVVAPYSPVLSTSSAWHFCPTRISPSNGSAQHTCLRHHSFNFFSRVETPRKKNTHCSARKCCGYKNVEGKKWLRVKGMVAILDTKGRVQLAFSVLSSKHLNDFFTTPQ